MDQMQPSSLDEDFLNKTALMASMVQNQAGISFLQWLCRLSGFNKSIMSLEDASRRDLWLTLRQFIPVEKLSEIEHHDLKQQQATLHKMMEIAASEEEIYGN